MLGDEELNELGSLIADVNQSTAPPIQILAQIMNLLGKKAGGHRCICTMASLYRLSKKLEAGEESKWNGGIAHDRDAAQRGAGALKAAEYRLIQQEIKQATGKSVLKILWGLAK